MSKTVLNPNLIKTHGLKSIRSQGHVCFLDEGQDRGAPYSFFVVPLICPPHKVDFLNTACKHSELALHTLLVRGAF